MRATCSFLGLALVAFAALPGCGGGAQDATSKELSALTAEISRLRAEQAAFAGRLDALERGSAGGPAAPAAGAPRGDDAAAAPQAARSLDTDRPSLDVVRLGPTEEDDDADGDTDADGPRTVLRSGANGIIVEEQVGPGGASKVVSAGGGKAPPAPKKSDKADRRKTASLPTP